jgi:hypothetical protein
MGLLHKEYRVLVGAIGMIMTTILLTMLASTLLIDTSTLPPMGAFYTANDLGWISFTRGLSAVVVGTCMYLMMWVTALDVVHHRNEAVRLRHLANSILFAVAGSWAYTNLGMVVWGGFWHVMGLGFSLLTSVAAIYAAITYVQTREALLEIEE